jgi:hypothetical protein
MQVGFGVGVSHADILSAGYDSQNEAMTDFAGGAPVTGSLEVSWIHGAPGEPAIQVHRYDEHTVILRQGKSVHYEAPFLYLLFGNDRAVLLDTGATADPRRFPLRETVDRLVAGWLDGHPRDGYELVVAHTHGHGDHVAADAQFAGRARFDDFIIYNEARRGNQVKLLARGLLHRIRPGGS